MKLGISIGMPTMRFQPVRNPGSASRWIWVSSWMNISARYIASAATSPATSCTARLPARIAVAMPA